MVAVKVRHPGVSATMQRDFALMQRAAALSARIPFLSKLNLEVRSRERTPATCSTRWAHLLKQCLTDLNRVTEPGRATSCWQSHSVAATHSRWNSRLSAQGGTSLRSHAAVLGRQCIICWHCRVPLDSGTDLLTKGDTQLRGRAYGNLGRCCGSSCSSWQCTAAQFTVSLLAVIPQA